MKSERSQVSNGAMCNLNPSQTWVLVGNGPSSNKRELGQIIDAHDNIVRFNRYVTLGYESKVGSKTTHWATHGLPWVAPDNSRTTPMSPAKNEPDPDCAILVHPVACPIEVPFICMRKGITEELGKRLSLATGQIPSTGITTIYWLLRDIGVPKLHLVGFDGFSKIKHKTHHYWDNKKYKRPKEHDGDAELKLLRHWSSVGRVSFLT